MITRYIIAAVLLAIGALIWLTCAFEARKTPYLTVLANRYKEGEISRYEYTMMARAEDYSEKAIEEAIQ